MNLKAEHLDASWSKASFKDKDVIQTWRPEKEEQSFPLCLWTWRWPYRAPWIGSTDKAASDIQLPCRAARSCRLGCENEEGSPVRHWKLLEDQVWIMAAYVLVKDIKAKTEDEIK